MKIWLLIGLSLFPSYAWSDDQLSDLIGCYRSMEWPEREMINRAHPSHNLDNLWGPMTRRGTGTPVYVRAGRDNTLQVTTPTASYRVRVSELRLLWSEAAGLQPFQASKNQCFVLRLPGSDPIYFDMRVQEGMLRPYNASVGAPFSGDSEKTIKCAGRYMDVGPEGQSVTAERVRLQNRFDRTARDGYRELMTASASTVRRDLDFHASTGPGMRDKRPDPAALARRIRQACLTRAQVLEGDENRSLKARIEELVRQLENPATAPGGPSSAGGSSKTAH